MEPPSIKTICPKGTPKFTMCLSIPSLFSQVSTLVAKAAEEEPVLTAIIKVGNNFLINSEGETFLRILTSKI